MAVVGTAVALAFGFAVAPASATGDAVGGAGNEYFLNDSFTGAANHVFTYGEPGDTVLVGDWDGDGSDTLAIRRANTFFVRNSTSSGTADRVFSYGDPGDTVLVGDWDGNGTDTLAVRRANAFYVKNSVTTGTADRTFVYGDPGDIALVGDWDGNGTDSLAVRRGGSYFVKNTLTTGTADSAFNFGDPGDTVLVGRWSRGQLGDTLGVRRSNTFYLRYSLTSGRADAVFGYGDPGDTAFVGDWNGDGIDTLGVRRPFTDGNAAGPDPAPTPTTPAPAQPAPPAFDVAGLDLHDGMIVQTGGLYYLYGSQYACGFYWLAQNTPWCGFAVSTSTDKVHWSTPTLLFDPASVDTWNSRSWQQVCGGTGAGCFNPRMIQRSGWGADDGLWMLWFNAPQDWNESRATPYYVMGCEGPAGPCGAGDGGPHGSTIKPNLGPYCVGNGDFTVVTQPSGRPVAICTDADQTLSEAELDYWGTGWDGNGARNLAGLTSVESPGAYQDPATGTWILTYSDPNCGYCTSDGTGYATATSLLGPWRAPTASTGGRLLTTTSCGGQPRTISIIDGYPFEGVDLWNGSRNETYANLHFEPLTYHGSPPPGSTHPPFDEWHCAAPQ